MEARTGRGKVSRWDFSSNLFFGTATRLILFGEPGQGRVAAGAWRAIECLFRQIEEDVSPTRPDSPVARYNRAREGEPAMLGGHAAQLFRAAETLRELSGGAYDPTVAPLVELWGFSATQRNRGVTCDGVPSQRDIARTRRLVGPGAFRAAERGEVGVELVKTTCGCEDEADGEEPAEATHAGSSAPTLAQGLDFGGIAKGYALDGALAIMREGGFIYGVLDCGGSGLALMSNPHTEDGAWDVPVENPLHPGGEPCIRLRLHDTVLTTSADYQHARILDGRRVGHIVNPATGFPAGWDNPRGAGRVACSVLVGAPASAADALATALCAMSPDQALELVRQDWFAQVYRCALLVAHGQAQGGDEQLTCMTNLQESAFATDPEIVVERFSAPEC